MRRLLPLIFLGALSPLSLMAQPATTATSAAEAAATPAARSALNFGVDEAAEVSSGPITLSAGTYAVFHTSEGDVLAELFRNKAPKLVENFVGLATGAKTWKHPVTSAEMNTPVYNNTTIYKTVENALLYGGDPLNRGVGDPGHTQSLEFSPDLRFDEPGMIAMDLSGPNASGSRWIMALRSFPDWSNRYPIFGRITAGMDVARAISRRPAKRPTVPLDPVLVSSVEIVEIPAGKTAAASYSTEDGRRYITVEKLFSDAAGASPPLLDGATTAPSAAAEQTTASAAAGEKKAENKSSKSDKTAKPPTK